MDIANSIGERLSEWVPITSQSNQKAVLPIFCKVFFKKKFLHKTLDAANNYMKVVELIYNFISHHFIIHSHLGKEIIRLV